MLASFLYVYVCVCVCVCVHLRVIFCMWHVHVFCVFYWVFVCICRLDWRRDLVPSWSRLGWKFPGVPASLFVHKPSIERPHKHVKVAKHLDNVDKKIIIRNIFFISVQYLVMLKPIFFYLSIAKSRNRFPEHLLPFQTCPLVDKRWNINQRCCSCLFYALHIFIYWHL